MFDAGVVDGEGVGEGVGVGLGVGEGVGVGPGVGVGHPNTRVKLSRVPAGIPPVA